MALSSFQNYNSILSAVQKIWIFVLKTQNTTNQFRAYVHTNCFDLFRPVVYALKVPPLWWHIHTANAFTYNTVCKVTVVFDLNLSNPIVYYSHAACVFDL